MTSMRWYCRCSSISVGNPVLQKISLFHRESITYRSTRISIIARIQGTSHKCNVGSQRSTNAINVSIYRSLSLSLRDPLGQSEKLHPTPAYKVITAGQVRKNQSLTGRGRKYRKNGLSRKGLEGGGYVVQRVRGYEMKMYGWAYVRSVWFHVPNVGWCLDNHLREEVSDLTCTVLDCKSSLYIVQNSIPAAYLTAPRS